MGCENPLPVRQRDGKTGRVCAFFCAMTLNNLLTLVRRAVIYLNKQHNSLDCSQPPDHLDFPVVFFMGERMKKIFILGTLLCAATARAEIPTVQYVLEYYERACGGNPEVRAEILKDIFYPDIDGSSVATQYIALNVIDNWINSPQTTYAANLSQNNVMSTKYLDDTLKLINDLEYCCVGGAINPDTWECVSCPADLPGCCPDSWDADSGTCATCPGNFSICCPDSWDVASGACVTCPGDYAPCCPNTWDMSTRTCVSCPGSGYVWDSAFGMCVAPNDLYDDTYTGTMTAGPTCTPRMYVRENMSCPTGWERVELSHAYMVNIESETEIDIPYSHYGDWIEEDNCMLDLLQAPETITPVDVCMPPIKDFAVYSSCENSKCLCRVESMLLSNGTEQNIRTRPVVLKRYSQNSECKTSCTAACRDALRTLPGFRRAVLATDGEECTV